MSELPLVTVVVPCMNRASLLRPTIDSILNQDYPNVECIVVDAASKDGTVEILRSYGDRIRWVSEKDKGHADAINKGWKMGRGEIVAWLNADDVFDTPSGLRHAVEHLVAHPDVDLVYGDCGTIDMEGQVVGTAYLHEWDLAYAVEHCDHCIPQPAAVMRRSIIEKIGWLDIAFYQKKDHELWLRIALAGKIMHIPKRVALERNLKGLSFEGRTAAPACLQVTKKFFSLPNVPDAIRRRERRALSNACLRAMDYAWAGGRCWRLVFKNMLLAVIYDPTNAHRAAGRALLYVRRWRPDPA